MAFQKRNKFTGKVERIGEQKKYPSFADLTKDCSGISVSGKFRFYKDTTIKGECSCGDFMCSDDMKDSCGPSKYCYNCILFNTSVLLKDMEEQNRLY